MYIVCQNKRSPHPLVQFRARSSITSNRQGKNTRLHCDSFGWLNCDSFMFRVAFTHFLTRLAIINSDTDVSNVQSPRIASVQDNPPPSESKTLTQPQNTDPTEADPKKEDRTATVEADPKKEDGKASVEADPKKEDGKASVEPDPKKEDGTASVEPDPKKEDGTASEDVGKNAVLWAHTHDYSHYSP